MKLLVIGGTAFVGRHLVEAALAEKHEVTLFHRGRTGLELFPEAERILGDRAKDLEKLAGRRWDAVVDVNGRLPAEVRAAAQFLKGSVGRYLFISTVSVYARWGEEQDEQAEVRAPRQEAPRPMTGEAYGALKVACERAVEELYAADSTLVRPGLIVGPYDSSDRFTYWPSRVARGGPTLAPGSPARLTQFIDVRDLAAWIVKMAGESGAGTFNAVGDPVAMGALLETIRTVVGGRGRWVWKDDAFLTENGVEPYTEMPLWIPGTDANFDGTRARARGLAFRPLADTIRDVLRWDRTRPADAPRANGMDAGRESALLAL